MKQPRIRTSIILPIAFVVMIVTVSCAPSAAPARPTRSATTVDAQASSSNLKAIGTFMSANQTTLAFQASGRVKEIKVKEGDKVQAGALLASLDTSISDLQVAQAQAALDTAQARLDQLKNPSTTDVTAAQAAVASAEAALAQLKTPTLNDLKIAKADLDSAQAAVANAQANYDRIGGDTNPFGAMTPQALVLQQASNNYQKALAVYNAKTNPSDAQVKQAEAGVDQARSQLTRLTNPSANDVKSAQAAVTQAQAAFDLAKQNVANGKIVAPFDGTVMWITPHLGETASPGVPAITLADLSRMQVQTGVDENTLGLMRIGQTAAITADAFPGKTFSGKVSKIGILATTTAGIVTIPVTIDLDASEVQVYPGLTATIEFQK
jgi:HlyD family secretion protein